MTVLGSIEFSLTMCPRKFRLCCSWLFRLPEDESKCCWLSNIEPAVDMILFENKEEEWWRFESLLLAREIEPPPADIVSVSPRSCPPIPLLWVLQEILSSSGIVGGGGGSSPSSPVEKQFWNYYGQIVIIEPKFDKISWQKLIDIVPWDGPLTYT